MLIEPLTVAQVTPFPWESGHAVNRQVSGLAAELVRRGHHVVIAATSTDAGLVRESRRLVRAGAIEPGGEPVVIAVGEALAAPGASSLRRALPVDAGRTIEELLLGTAFDVCHVHDPFAPSAASAALRTSRALNVGTFHAPSERLVATQVAKKLTDLVFGRLDARLASFLATADLMERHFAGRYDVVRPAADAPVAEPGAGGPVRLVFLEEEERGALRTFLRALRLLPADGSWEAVVVTDRGESTSTPLREEIRRHVRVMPVADAGTALAGADIVVCASDGAAPAPETVLRGIAAGAVPVCSSLPVYEEACGEGDLGLLAPPKDAETLGRQLERLIADGALRERLRAAADPVRAQLGFTRLADEIEAVYAGVVARRHDPDPQPALRRRLAQRPWIDVDLHMHTDHSHDCATPVEVLLATARDQGLGAIAVTDHNEISGALEAAEKAERFGVKVIVGEEVKTASQGEVIGLFLTEKIPRGLTLEATVAEIRRQGGVVYVPHPFDRMHSVPDYEHLLSIVEDVDGLEVYNPRVAIGSFNEEAARFAAKYRLAAGAGSDSHVAQGLGSVRVRMPDFDGPDEFKVALRMAEIHTKPSSLLYVQALKFLENVATPPGARKARKERRVRKATRKA